MIDIRKEFAQVLAKYGHSIIYVRRNLHFRCKCYIERSGEAKLNCSRCFGTGYEVVIEKKLARRKEAYDSETLVEVNQLQPYGTYAPKAYTYYLDYGSKPEKNDLILEVVWDEKEMPIKIKEKLLISAVEPKFGVKGRTEFYQVYSRYDFKGDSDEWALTKR
ncbi:MULTISPECIES: hypothetical protein [Bacillus cereus group]|uniref:Uncharacterized protein n=1 Tax=Bacillus cereus (strain G9842) TaxID=405531 RepID=B7IZG9_BACC2|nr:MULTISPECIES: hypothetical protein [Bacillus cereus group]MBS9805831.1 hypothetical protein [Bacillus toyonensis]ACK98799.1 hypothetical protein BCG9842_A0096 [Bacillus cereus G9842]MCU5508155.1 hypothetical protein [Bacillus cereus]MDA2417008.1 hypothetical protein [Bacillus cereus]MDR4135813.1 hypothetical protein [Bacillus cereus]